MIKCVFLQIFKQKIENIYKLQPWFNTAGNNFENEQLSLVKSLFAI